MIRDEFQQYARLIHRQLRRPDPPDAPPEEAAVGVERGEVLVSAVLGDGPLEIEIARMEPLVRLGRQGLLHELPVQDRGGHRRSVYRPLLVYAWLQGYRLMYEALPPGPFGQWETALRDWCDQLERDLADAPRGDALPAASGSAAAAAAWSAAALHQAGKLFIRDAWADLASQFFGQLVRAQQDDGAFLTASASDNPETHWYHELAILHAAAAHAVQSENRPLAAAVARNTAFHLEQTQPDHATSEPWGIFAFIWDSRTRSLADQMLHALAAAAPQGVRGVPAILLSDALLCLRLFE